jgi:hypothetical protein
MSRRAERIDQPASTVNGSADIDLGRLSLSAQPTLFVTLDEPIGDEESDESQADTV